MAAYLSEESGATDSSADWVEQADRKAARRTSVRPRATCEAMREKANKYSPRLSRRPRPNLTDDASASCRSQSRQQWRAVDPHCWCGKGKGCGATEFRRAEKDQAVGCLVLRR